MGLRVHRVISWIHCAEQSAGNDDACFIFLWIAFNAAYADEHEFHLNPPKERSAFRKYFGKLVQLDQDRRIYNALWDEFPGPVRMLMDNKYVFEPFWKHQNGIPGFQDWEKSFKKSRIAFHKAFGHNETVAVLSMLFERLYTLRNQLVHGGSTWHSGINREQVRNGAAILGALVPVFVDLMMNNPKADWGLPFYPPVDI